MVPTHKVVDMSVEKMLRVIEVLSNESPVSRNRIAIATRSDRRTIEKVIRVGSEMGIIKCETVEIGARRYSSCSLDPDYIEMLRKKNPQNAFSKMLKVSPK